MHLPLANSAEMRETTIPAALCTPDGTSCLRRFRSDRDVVAFIHIGKAGGTSFDGMLSATVTTDGADEGLVPMKSELELQQYLTSIRTSSAPIRNKVLVWREQ